MKFLFKTLLTSFLTLWLSLSPWLETHHYTTFHNRYNLEQKGLCKEECENPAHRRGHIHHKWCQVRLAKYIDELPYILLKDNIVSLDCSHTGQLLFSVTSFIASPRAPPAS